MTLSSERSSVAPVLNLVVETGATLGHSLRAARGRLHAAGIEDAEIEAELILREALREAGGDTRSWAYLFQRLNEIPTESQTRKLDALLARRLAREPSAYITGQREFRGLELSVTPDVLIPRPETELLVDQGLAVLAAMPSQRPPIVADIGTGSGAVAIAMALERPDTFVLGTDVSWAALAVARRNAERHGVQRRIDFRHGDLLQPVHDYVDLIVANLPYVTTGDWAGLAPELREHEPRLALDGGNDGLDPIRALLHQAPSYLRPSGAVCLEFGIGQRDAIIAAAASAFPHASIDVLDDFGGIPRVLTVRQIARG